MAAESQLPNAVKYSDLVSANSALRQEIWSELVRRDARSKNVIKDFIGGEGSGKPIVEKRDLAAGGSDKVTFTTTAPIRGQGVLGETLLKDATKKLRFGTFNVTVDLLRHAVSWTQVLRLMRFTGKTLDQLSAEVMAEWWGRKEQDDILISLRNAGLENATTNLIRPNGVVAQADLATTDILNTNVLETGKQLLMSLGAKEMGVEKDVSGHETPKYLFFGPEWAIRGLRSSSTYLQALREADTRGPENRLFSGKYAMWDNNVIYSQNLQIDTADGRQGSPLAPIAYLGTALASGVATTITGGGTANPAGDGDYFAYFPGFPWTFSSQVAATVDADTHYALIYNVSGADKGKYEVVSYVQGGFHTSGKQLTVTRDVGPSDSSKKSLVHPSGSIIVPCNADGYPINWCLHLGGDALMYAKGAVDAEQIYHWDDFKNAKDEAHLSAVGIQGVRGYGVYKDTNGRIPGVIAVETVASIPGVKL